MAMAAMEGRILGKLADVETQRLRDELAAEKQANLLSKLSKVL